MCRPLPYDIIMGMKEKILKNGWHIAKNIFITFSPLIIITIVIIASFVIMNWPLSSTDLSGILIDGLIVSSPAAEINPQKYGDSRNQLTESHIYEIKSSDSAKDLLFISLNNGRISFISMTFDNETVPITINGHNVNTIEEVQRLLGRTYRESEYDHEHDIMMRRYHDHERYVRADFLYDKETHHLVKLILDRLPE